MVVVLVALEAEVPLSCFARAWNAAKLFEPDSGALTENTMPSPQWLTCLQKAQRGAVCKAELVKNEYGKCYK